MSGTTVIHDAGRKIGGARKDLWRERGLSQADLDGLTTTEAHEVVTKDAVWPKPDWKAMVDGGVTSEVAAHIKAIRDKLAARPREADPEGRRAYVRMMGILRDTYMACRTVQDFKNARHKILYDYLDWGGKAQDPDTRRVLFSVYKGRREPFSLTVADGRKIQEMLQAGWPESGPVPAWKKGVEILHSEYRGHYARRRHDRAVIIQGLGSAEAVEAWLMENRGPAAKQGNGAVPHRPHLDVLERIGPDFRRGRDVTSEDFVEIFGFYGVEWGLWVDGPERQDVANRAFDALMDLADVLDLSPAAMSLDGRLGMAFGARGSGNASAHYEPGRAVINLTKLRGAGSLAHEWAHALDHMSGVAGEVAHDGRPRGGTGWDRRLQTPGTALPNLLPDAQAAWDGMQEALHYRVREDGSGFSRQKSSYFNEALKISGASGYWARPTELFARAFECMVHDRLLATGRQSDYLVHSVEWEPYDNPCFKGNPYPGGIEREIIEIHALTVVEAMAPTLGLEPGFNPDIDRRATQPDF